MCDRRKFSLYQAVSLSDLSVNQKQSKLHGFYVIAATAGFWYEYDSDVGMCASNMCRLCVFCLVKPLKIKTMLKQALIYTVSMYELSSFIGERKNNAREKRRESVLINSTLHHLNKCEIVLEVQCTAQSVSNAAVILESTMNSCLVPTEPVFPLNIILV